MDRLTTIQQDLKYVMGCLAFCAETLARLGHEHLAEQLAQTCASLTTIVQEPQMEQRYTLN